MDRPLTYAPEDWTRLATALEAAGAQTLAHYIRAGLRVISQRSPPAALTLRVTPGQATKLQRLAAELGIARVVPPTASDPVPGEGERGDADAAGRAAVAAAEALLRAARRGPPPERA